VIEPGIETDDTTLERLRPYSIRVECPYCKAAHELPIKNGHLFKMRPRQSRIHSTALLCDEIDVGALVERTLSAAQPEQK
jgi:hypothetical protein